MKLFFSKGACSLAPHIVAYEAKLPMEAESVNLKTKETATGKDYKQINSKGSVPALLLDNGQLLTEGAVIMQYLADQKPEAKLIPAAGTFERYRALEWLNYIATELHKTFSPLWNPQTPAAFKEITMEKLTKQFAYLNNHLAKSEYLMGSSLTAADAYLFTVLSWTGHLEISLSQFPNLPKFLERMKARPAVQAALKAEGF